MDFGNFNPISQFDMSDPTPMGRLGPHQLGGPRAPKHVKTALMIETMLTRLRQSSRKAISELKYEVRNAAVCDFES